MTAHPPASPAAPPSPAGAWLKLSAAMAEQAAQIAGRDDLLVTCAPGAGHGHPACFLPDHAHIEVNGSLLGVDPATADPARPSDRVRYPVTWGTLIHECAHARHTAWSPPPGSTAAWAEAATMLEESRIEYAQVTRRPGDRRWLRASAAGLILKDFAAAGAGPSSPTEAGSAAALLLARADAGVLDQAETQDAERAVAQVLGTTRLARLRQVWREAHATADTDARTMLKLGRRWCRILGIEPDAPARPASSGNGQGQPAPSGQPTPSPIGRAVQASAAKIARAAAEDFTPPPPGGAVCRNCQAGWRQAVPSAVREDLACGRCLRAAVMRAAVVSQAAAAGRLRWRSWSW